MTARQRAKGVAKRALRPFLGRLHQQARVALHDEIQSLEDLRRQLDLALPAVLNRISEQAASERGIMRTVDDIYRRIEFVRRELLVELRYGGERAAAPKKSAGRVVHHEKLAGMGEQVRLNLGAGHIPVDGYLNVDSRDLDHIDVVASVDDLPFDAESLQEIYSAHLLEHFPVEELRKVLLPYWVAL